MTFNKNTYKEVFEAADKVFQSSQQVSVSAMTANGAAVNLDATQPAFEPQNLPQQQVAAQARAQRGASGRGGRGNARGGQNNRNGQRGGGQSRGGQNSGQGGQGGRGRGPVIVPTHQKAAVTAIIDMGRTLGIVQPHSHALGSTSAQLALHEGQADLDEIILTTTLCFPD